MSMLDFYTKEQAIEAFEDSKRLKAELQAEIERIDTCMFLLRYYIETGDALDPEVFGIEPEEDEDDR